MYCTVCQKAEKRPFDRYTWNKIPATHLRLESIKSYENCVAHKDAVRQLALVAQYETMPKTFACLYFLCKNRIAHTINFGPLLDLIGFLGVNLK